VTDDRWFIAIGIPIALVLAAGGVYLWGLILGWWAL
jgi:hypothetical protein